MTLKRLTVLTLMGSLAVALLGWDLTRSKARNTVIPAKHQLDRDHEADLILQGTLIPMITTPIAVRDLKLVVPLNTQVQQGDVIGVAPVQITPAEIEHAQSERANAESSVIQAEERLRDVNEELTARRTQASNMSTQESAAQSNELEAEGEFARKETLFRSGLASERDYDTAAVARGSADTALASLRSDMASTQVEIDEWEARVAEAQGNLDAARERRNTAKAPTASAQRTDQIAPVVSPGNGAIVVSEDPLGTNVGIASDPGQLCAYAKLPQADVTSIRIGQPALVVLDGEPAVTLQATVTAISEIPLDSPEGATYPVALSVENPGRTWLSGLAVHVLIEGPPL